MFFLFPNKTELLQNLFKVDEDYYRYVFQLESDFTPEFKAPEVKKSNGFYTMEDDE